MVELTDVLFEPTPETKIDAIGKALIPAVEIQLINEKVRSLPVDKALVLWMYRGFSNRHSVYSVEDFEHAQASFTAHQERPQAYNPVLSKVYRGQSDS